jgi:outer membrane protein TolC
MARSIAILVVLGMVEAVAQTTLALPAVPSPAERPSAPAQFQGSVPSENRVPGVLALTLEDAIQRGLRQNLGLVLGDLDTHLAQADRLRSLSALLPNLTARVSDSVEQINLKALGFNFTFPGIPSVVGPFNVFDARASYTQNLLSLPDLNRLRASRENVHASQLTYKDSRDVVVLLVASGYLQIIADQARVDEAVSEVTTAQALSDRAEDLLKNGITPAIDALRARVELQSEQTRLRSYRNDFAKDKLVLARLIGLAPGQEFTLATDLPFQPFEGLSLDQALGEAYKTRADYQALQAQVRASELSKRAAHAQRYPSIASNADYGDIGPNPAESHGTFTLSAGVSMSIFDGGRIRADEDQADAEIQQRRAQLADLRGQIDSQVRTAFLDLETAADQVALARSSLDLARQTLEQGRDRFAAGVTDNIEVVQAQNSVASASESYINSVFAHNLAKVTLSRAIGSADARVQQYLGGK